MGLSRVAK